MLTMFGILLLLFFQGCLPNKETADIRDDMAVRVYRTFYCATGEGCDKPICGGNKRTATGSDATKAGGCAVDPRRIPYGSIVEIDGARYVADDTFGKRQRERDWEAGIVHVDIRVVGKTHREVHSMGAGYVDAKIERKGE